MSSTNHWLAYVQLLDSAFPIGSFAHSFGLETFVQKGKISSLLELEQYVYAQLKASIIPLDVSCIRETYCCLSSEEEATKLQRLLWLDAICHTQRAARESREGMHKMGKRLMKLGKKLYPETKLEVLEQILERDKGYGSYPLVFAWIGWHLDIELDMAITGYLYATIGMTVNSALRLMSLGQTDGQLLIRRIVQKAEQLWSEVKHENEEPYSIAIVNDIYAMQHETLYSRLFMS